MPSKSVGYSSFQFHKGTIRTAEEGDICSRHLHFNSIKVQLEHIHPHSNLLPLPFQFHKGTIRTELPQLEADYGKVFQFHKGTIRTYRQPDAAILHQYFNSIKVQLEQLKVKITRGVSVFQFHKGTIRTRL